MKKRIILLVLPFLMATSCGTECETCPETPKPDAINEMLKALSEGFSAESKLFVTQDFGLNSDGEESFTWYTVCRDIDVSGDTLLSSLYESDYLTEEEVNSGNYTYLHEEENLEEICIFAKNPDSGSLATSYLGIDNIIHYEDVIDSASNEALTYSTTFENPFKYLTEDDFTKVDDTTYTLNKNDFKLTTIYQLLANYIYAEPYNYSVEDFTIKTDGTSITGFSGTFIPYEYTGWTCTETMKFETTITNIGKDSFDAPAPVEGKAITELDETLKSLKENNYDVVSYNESENSWTGAITKSYVTGSSNGKEVIQRNFDTDVEPIEENITKEYYFYGYEEDYWGTMKNYTQKTVRIGDEYFYSTNRVEASMKDSMLPTFNISSALFTETDVGTYTLKDDLPYYLVLGNTGVFSIFRSNSMTDLTIKIANNEVTFETVGGSYIPNEHTTYTNIGGVSEILVNEDKINATADEKLTRILDYVFKESDKTKLIDAIGEECLNEIPTPGGVCTDVSISASSSSKTSQFRFALDLYDPDLQYDNLLVHYADELNNRGFTYDPSYDSGYMYTKDVVVDSTSYEYQVSFGISGSYFVVDADLISK